MNPAKRRGQSPGSVEESGAQLERLLSVEEVAALVGVPPKSIHTWLYTGRGPKSLRVGKYRRFRQSDVAAWLDSLTETHR